MFGNKQSSTVLSSKYGGGPKGLGDPEDRSLRKVESEVLIPKKMRDIAKTEKCNDEVRKFSECCRDNSLLMVVRCRKENTTLRGCLEKWYLNEEFKEKCKEEYLNERSEYRRTGVPKKQTQRLPSSM